MTLAKHAIILMVCLLGNPAFADSPVLSPSRPRETSQATPVELADLERTGIEKLDLSIFCNDSGLTIIETTDGPLLQMDVKSRHMKPLLRAMILKKLELSGLQIEENPRLIRLPCLFVMSTCNVKTDETWLSVSLVNKFGDHNAVVWQIKSTVDTNVPEQVTAGMEKLVDQFVDAVKPYVRKPSLPAETSKN